MYNLNEYKPSINKVVFITVDQDPNNIYVYLGKRRNQADGSVKFSIHVLAKTNEEQVAKDPNAVARDINQFVGMIELNMLKINKIMSFDDKLIAKWNYAKI